MRVQPWRTALIMILLAALSPWRAQSMASAVQAAMPHLAPGFGSLPLSFEPNVGQSDPAVRFLTHGSDYTLFLTDSGPVMSLALPSVAKSAALSTLPSPLLRRDASPSPTAAAVISLRLLGANPHPRLTGENKLPGIVNYFIGNVPSGWHTHIPTYAQVRYRNVYPGIDLVYFGRQGAPEYDFVVEPGANPARLHLALSAESNGLPLPTALDGHGNLVVRLPGGTLVQQAPVIYQRQGAQHIRVAGRFTLTNGQLGLRLGAYDRTRPLVVDPTLVYSTFLGGRDYDQGLGVAVDGQGNAYVTGSTSSPNFPLRRPLQAHFGGGPSDTAPSDAFVAALSADGRTLRYSTYLGGSGNEFGNGIAVDGHGDAYLAGEADSSTYPLNRPLQAHFGGGEGDAFVAKISSS